MKQSSEGSRGLHLVTREESLAGLQEDNLVAQGVQRYQELQARMDRALFSQPQDVETIGEILSEMNLLRERLRSYGVRIA